MRTTPELETLRPYLPQAEFKALSYSLDGEEGDAINQMLAEQVGTIATMPVTYGQQHAADPIVYLHYFHPSNSDWYILEKDVSGLPHHQAFGWVILGGDLQNAELGYISIAELVSVGAELDLYWTPAPLSQVKAGKEV